MEKYDKDWEDECLPRGPKAPLSPHLAVEEGHALCWPEPEEMKATWLLSQPSRCSEYRGSPVGKKKRLGFSTQTVRLLSGASQRDQVPTTASCPWVVGNTGSHRTQMAPAFTQQTWPSVCAEKRDLEHRGYHWRRWKWVTVWLRRRREGGCGKKQLCAAPSEQLSVSRLWPLM